MFDCNGWVCPGPLVSHLRELQDKRLRLVSLLTKLCHHDVLVSKNSDMSCEI